MLHFIDLIIIVYFPLGTLFTNLQSFCGDLCSKNRFTVAFVSSISKDIKRRQVEPRDEKNRHCSRGTRGRLNTIECLIKLAQLDELLAFSRRSVATGRARRRLPYADNKITKKLIRTAILSHPATCLLERWSAPPPVDRILRCLSTSARSVSKVCCKTTRISRIAKLSTAKRQRNI